MTPDDVKRQYESETGLSWTDLEGVRWANVKWPLGLEYRPVKYRSVYADLSDKASWIGQQPCLICRPDVPIYHLSIRVAPQSWQYLGALDKRAFLAAIAHHFSQRSIIPLMGKVCLRVVFICKSARPTKDLDNMAKALLDGVKTALMRDDRDVDHLELIRLTHEGDEEFVRLRISSSALDDGADVVVPQFMHRWGGQEALNLEDFR